MSKVKSSTTKNQPRSKAPKTPKTLKPRRRARILMHFMIYPDFCDKVALKLLKLETKCNKGNITIFEVRNELRSAIETLEAGMFETWTDKGTKV